MSEMRICDQLETLAYWHVASEQSEAAVELLQGCSRMGLRRYRTELENLLDLINVELRRRRDQEERA